MGCNDIVTGFCEDDDGGAVASVFGRIGDVEATLGDYSASLITAVGPLGTTQVQAAIDNIPPAWQHSAGIGPTVSGTGAVTYFSLTTPAIAAGTYEASWAVVFSLTATGGGAGCDVTFNAVSPTGGPVRTAANPQVGSKLGLAGSNRLVHAGGTIAVICTVNRPFGTGNVIPQNGLFTLRRVA